MLSYQELLCEVCEHKFMQDMSSFGWYPNYRVKIKGRGEEFYMVKCPMCNEEVFAMNGKMQTIARIGLNEDEFEIEQAGGI